MIDLLSNIQSSVRLIDLLDVSIVAFIVYRVLLLIKGTRAMQMVTGLGILGICFYLSSMLELFTTHWLFSYFFDYLILIIIVLFQDDLRRALTHVGKNPFFSSNYVEEELQMVDEIARATFHLAHEGIGALIVIERETGLKNFIDTGSRMDCLVKAELLEALFMPNSPIHDGAVIVKGNRIAAAGCFLPLSKDPNIDKSYGSRHRAALGISEDSDALVVLISEDFREAHLVQDGKIMSHLSQEEFKKNLIDLLKLTRQASLRPYSLKSPLEDPKKVEKIQWLRKIS